MRKLTLLTLLLLVLPACDSAEADVDVIGGAYATTEDTPYGVYTVNIPAGTQSNPDATFTGTQTEDAGSYTYTGTYDHPSLKLDFGEGDVVNCTVADDHDSLDCTIVGERYTLNRQ